MVCWSGFSNWWKLGIRYIYWYGFNYSLFSNLLVWLIFNKSWNICKDLYRSVQIRTETFFKTSNKMGTFFRRALFNQLISFSKTEFMNIQFSNNPGISVRICADLYRFAGSAQHGCMQTLCEMKKFQKSSIVPERTRFANKDNQSSAGIELLKKRTLRTLSVA